MSWISRCQFSGVCEHYRKDSKTCQNIEANHDEYTCGTYRNIVTSTHVPPNR